VVLRILDTRELLEDTSYISIPPEEKESVFREPPIRIWIENPNLRDRLLHEGSLFLLGAGIIGLSFAKPALQSRGLWVSVPCLFRAITHIPCFACGLTRSFSLTSHGKFVEAFKMHLLGPPLFFLTTVLTTYLGFVLQSGKRIRIKISPKVRALSFRVAILIVAICWLIKIVFLRSSW